MTKVNGLPLPCQLVEMIHDGTWKHPGDQTISRLIPFFEGQVDFLPDAETMAKSSSTELFDDPKAAELFYFSRETGASDASDLPYLNPDLSVFIAINSEIGGDIAIALDYRTDSRDPRVVANDWHSSAAGSVWKEVCPSFSAFIEAWEE